MTGKMYKHPHHNQRIMDHLNDQRKTGEFCDVTFLVEDKEIKAHKNILSASSPYFRSMFTEHFQESKLNKIPLYDMDYGALVGAIDFIYTSRIELNETNIYDIMDIIDILQLYSLKPYINDYLKRLINDQNCLFIYSICSFRNYVDVAQMSFLHILNNFKTISNSKDFKDMPADLWRKILNSDVINVESEKDLLDILLDWYIFCPEKRLQDINTLCSFINLSTLSLSQLQEYMGSKVIEGTDLLKRILILIESFDNKSSDETKLEDYQKQMAKLNLSLSIKERCNKFNSIIMAIEADSSCECFPSLHDPWSFSLPLWGPYNPTNESELVIAACPTLKSFASAHNDHEIFLLGGRDENFQITNKCYKYDVRLNTWSAFEELPMPLADAAAAFCDNVLYVTGGLDRNGSATDAVMYYMDKPGQEGKWVFVCPMLENRSSHVLCSVNGSLYAFGGVNKKYELSENDDNESIAPQSLEVYCPASNEWHYASSMPDDRIMFCAAVLDEYIYIFGGCTLKDSGNETTCVVERYDTLNDKWQLLEPMPFLSNNDSRAIAYKNRIYVIGGASKDAELQNCVFAFNPRSSKWQYVPPMRFPRAKQAVAVFQLPEHPVRVNERVRATQFRWQ